MKVGICFFTEGENIGGSYTFGYEVVKAISQNSANSNHEFVLLTPHFLPELQKHSSFKELIVLPDKKNMVSRLVKFVKRKISSAPFIYLPPLQRAIISEQLGIIYFIDPYHIIETDVPYIVTVWDLQHRLQPWFPEVRNGNTWEKREAKFSLGLGKAAYIITGTIAGKNEVKNFYSIPHERIAILPHPTPSFVESDFKTDDTVLDKFNIKHSGYLFYPAQFWAHKNHICILEAISTLKQQSKNIKAVFSGSDAGNLSYIREKAIEMDIIDNIIFTGFVTREELISLYQHAFALSYTSYFGPENMPPLEAFALGCPVIAANVSGSKEQLDDAALFFDPRDSADLVQAIIALENQQLREDLIMKGKKIAELRTVKYFVDGLNKLLDTFEPIRKCWK